MGSSMHSFEGNRFYLFDFAFNDVLAVFKIPAVLKLHQVARVVYLALEAAQKGLQWFPVASHHFNIHRHLRSFHCEHRGTYVQRK